MLNPVLDSSPSPSTKPREQVIVYQMIGNADFCAILDTI